MNSECARAGTLIQLLLDGRIDAKERRALDSHIAACEACAVAMDSYRQVSSMASEWARPAASEDPGAGFNDRLLKLLEAEAPAARQFRARRTWRTGLPAGVAIAFVCAGASWLARNAGLWASVSSLFAPQDWMRGAAQIPDALHGLILSAWSSFGALVSSGEAVSLPNWSTEAGAAAVVVNLYFLFQALSSRRRHTA